MAVARGPSAGGAQSPWPEVNSLEAFVVATDGAGIVTRINAFALRLGSLCADDIVGRPLADSAMFGRLPRSAGQVRDALRSAAAGNTVCRDIDIAASDGTRHTYTFRFLPGAGDGNGEAAAILVTGVDSSADLDSDADRKLHFWQRLGDATHDLEKPMKIMEVTTRLLGEHLNASRVVYADADDDGRSITIRHDYTNGCDSAVGRYSLAHFGIRAASAVQGGKTLVLRDIERELEHDSGRSAFEAIGVRAVISCPLVKLGRVAAIMSVHQAEARDWSASEVALVEHVVERCWANIERARSLQQLASKERQFEELFEFLPDALLMLDVEGHIALINQRAEEMFGYGRHELLGKHAELLLPEKLGALHRQVCESFAESAAVPPNERGFAIAGRRKDGSSFPTEVSLAPMETHSGPMIACSIRDTTERDRMQAQLQQSKKMETLGQMAGGVAHDFNNLLTVINATAELMIERSTDDDMRNGLATVLRAGEQATGLTRQLLAMSRQQELRPELVDLNDVLNDIEPLLQRLIGKDIAVRFRPASDPVTCRVDRAQIDQALMNLALNSRDAMPDGGTLIIETANVKTGKRPAAIDAELEPGAYALLSVADTGHGMDEETRRHMFEPFFTTKGHDKGTGLGLSTVYGMVKQSGGSVSAESEPGRGTTVRLILPRVLPGDVSDTTRPAAREAGNETILVVEDEQEILQVARIMLERRGYTVLTAEDGAQAVELVRTRGDDIDLVLSDVVMPGLSGPETMKQVQELRPGLPVLYMSGYTADLIAGHGVDRNPQFFLTKPFTLTELSRTVRAALDD